MDLLSMAILATVSFIQNITFTLSSRSRNSGDPWYHMRMAWLSNGVWFICYAFIMKNIWSDLTTGNWIGLLPVFVVYVLATSAGSAFGMVLARRGEKGLKKVGA